MNKLIFFLLLVGAGTLRAQPTYVTERNIRYYADSLAQTDPYVGTQCRLDVHYPKGTRNGAILVWFHGGGLTAGGKELPKALLEKGYTVVGVGYRLSPKVKAPAYLEDAAAAVAWVFRNAERYGGSPNLVFVSGHSAGGYLGLMLTLDQRYLARHGIDANRIAAVIPFSGQAITHYTIRQERGIRDTQPLIDPYAPLYHVRADAPPVLLITGDRELELLGRYEENAYLWRMLKLVGHPNVRLHELQGFDHGGMAEPAFPLLLKEVAARTKALGAGK